MTNSLRCQSVYYKGMAYIIASDDLCITELGYYSGPEIIKSVSCLGYRANDWSKSPFKIVWKADNPLAESTSELVSNWLIVDSLIPFERGLCGEHGTISCRRQCSVFDHRGLGS